jgi:2-dehydropantoate 2-reductase
MTKSQSIDDSDASRSTTEPILVWGGGAIGGTIAAYWARAGVPVLLVDIVADHVNACRTRGLRISGPIDEFTVRVPAATPAEVTGKFKRIVLAVKAPATEAALQMLAPHLADDGYVLSAQNGLNEIAIARTVGAERTMGCFVNFGSDWHGPGEVMFGNRSAVVVGELDGSARPRTREMFALLQKFEPDAILTDNIWGYLWGKLAYGAMLFATALTQDSMSANFADPRRHVVFYALAEEVMAVARARGITAVGFGNFDPSAFLPSGSDQARAKIMAWLAEYNRRSAKSHSGIWRDLAVRKRRTEVDQQISVITQLGHEVGLPTPVLTRLVSLIHDIEEGRRPMVFETFQVLLDTCKGGQ